MSFFNSGGYEEITEPVYQVLNSGNQDGTSCVIYGYTRSKTKTFLYHLISLLLCGIPYILCSWYPRFKVWSLVKHPLDSCDLLFVTDNHDNSSVVKIKNEAINIPNLGLTAVRYFYHQHTKYVWVQQKCEFDVLAALVPKNTVDDYLNDLNGLRITEYYDLLEVYGKNNIEVEVKSYLKLFKEEVFHPFYVFQLFSIILWCFDDYVIYAGCILILTAFSTITALIQTRRQSEALHTLVEASKCHEATVIRRFEDRRQSFIIDPKELVPGDLIIIPTSNYVMPCDAVLLTGQCIVNESMLTGESVPITKTAPHSCDEPYDTAKHKRYTLFAGTYIIQTRNYSGDPILARVVRTGFDTTKGALIKSILYPTPISLKFYKDSFRFVFVLFIVAAIGMTYCLELYIKRRASIEDIIIRTLDIITIVVPPALPAAMTVGIVSSMNRLKKMKIFTTSPQRINVCGKIKLACFDKTGTLTNDGLDMHSVIPCFHAQFRASCVDIAPFDMKSKLIQAMATCHSLKRIEGELQGDPLDLIMFDFTRWDLEEPGSEETARFDMLGPTVVKPNKDQQQLMTGGTGDIDDLGLDYEIGIVREFPFSSTLQCMSVICRELSTPHMITFVKGAPEKLLGMCLKSTVPKEFSSRLAQYTIKGYRVIAIAYKDLPPKFKWHEAQKVKRDAIECDLTFLGLLVMKNTLKPETTPVIDTLHAADIRTVMITGDNVLTAISVARECHMVKSHEQIFLIKIDDLDNNEIIPKITLENIGATSNPQHIAIDFGSQLQDYHLAIDGRTWDCLRLYYSDLLPEVLVKTTIFARFQPDQKTQLVMNFQSLDYVVSMVGDGANDCGALKAAHVGVSLSQAEASVAAPFTSSIPNISCLVHLILEGRCALVTSFAVFKYMALYSIIQFFSVLILYTYHSILGDYQFLYIDLILTTTMAVTIGYQGPSTKLCKQRPPASLVSLKTLIPLGLQVVICGAVQIAALYFLFQQPWFVHVPPPKHGAENIICWQNTVVFTVSAFQYIIQAVVHSKGAPFRKPLITNVCLLLSAIVLTGFTACLTVYPNSIIAEWFEVMYPKKISHEQITFRYFLLGFGILHFLIAAFIETCIADTVWLKKTINFLTRKKQPRNRYKLLIQEDHDIFNRIHNHSS